MEDLMNLADLRALERAEVPADMHHVLAEVAGRNHWLRAACDPPFSPADVRACASRRELWSWLSQGSWGNGSAFALCEGGRWLCFVQQGECTDEWLAVKLHRSQFKGRPVWLHLDFESISWGHILDRRPEKAETMLDDLFAATFEECQTLSYAGAAARQADPWVPMYAPWRHGGWYVRNVRYPSGACGCVSRNYADRKWRIVTENTGPGEPGDRTFPSRDAAARAERDRADEMAAQVALDSSQARA